MLAIEAEGANARDGPALKAGLEVEGEKAGAREEVLLARLGMAADEVDLGRVRVAEVEAGGRVGTGTLVVNFFIVDLKKREAAFPSRGLAAGRDAVSCLARVEHYRHPAHVRPSNFFSYSPPQLQRPFQPGSSFSPLPTLASSSAPPSPWSSPPPP